MTAALVLLSLSASLVTSGAAAPDNAFLGRDNFDDIRRSITDMLQVAHGGGNSPIVRKLAKIEETLARTFQALPKNALGRLAPRSVRHIVHDYFAMQHGWQIKGLEPQGMRTNVSEVHQISVLQDKSPALVEALMEAQLSDRGLALGDVAAMVALLERLILDESIALLEASYFLNNLSSSEGIEDLGMHEVLRSYLLVFEMGMKGDLQDTVRHQMIKQKVAALGGAWPAVVEFETNALLNYAYEMKDVTNPFVEKQFAFNEAAAIVDTLAQGFGKWQNAECGRMKDALISLDTDGSGLIPLSIFYAKSNKREYQFTETLEYLHAIGAIDDSWKREPHVRLANYVIGPSNCIASSNYYSVCCLSECDNLMDDIEASIQAPAASPERLLELVQKLTASDTSADLTSKLHLIAEKNEGEVPLHGRLFAQWLHLAFPHDCPFPHISDEGTELQAHHWLGGKAIASVEQRINHVTSVLNETSPLDETAEAPLPAAWSKWSDEEVLPLAHSPKRSTLGHLVRNSVQVAMFLVVLRIVLTGVSSVRNLGADSKGKPKVAVDFSDRHPCEV